MAAASWNDASPILSVSFEFVSLKWIDLIANDAGDHLCSSFEGSFRQDYKIAGFTRWILSILKPEIPSKCAASFLALSLHGRFVYHQNVNVENLDEIAVARIAGAIGEPARARMLFCLMDGHARTSTELATVADV